MATVYVATDAQRGTLAIGAAVDPVQHRVQSGRWYAGFRYLGQWEVTDAAACAHFLQRSFLLNEVSRRGPERWFELSLGEVRAKLPAWQAERDQHAVESRRVETLKRLRPMAGVRTPESKDQLQCERLREVRRQMEALEFEKERLELALKLRLEVFEELEGLCRWEYRESRRVDSRRLREARPQIFEQFSQLTGTRYFKLL